MIILFSFLSPLAYAIALPISYTEDARNYYAECGIEYEKPVDDHPSNWFWGSYSDTTRDIDQTWGPDSGWYLSLFSSLLFTIALILFYLDKRNLVKEEDELDLEYKKFRKDQNRRIVYGGGNIKDFSRNNNGRRISRNGSIEEMSDQELEEMLDRVRIGK